MFTEEPSVADDAGVLGFPLPVDIQYNAKILHWFDINSIVCLIWPYMLPI